MTFRNQVYHKLLEEFSQKKAFLIYLFGATPYAWETKVSEDQVSPKRSVAAQAKLATDKKSWDQAQRDLSRTK